MIVLDRREPDELETYVRALGIECVKGETELEFGDAMFSGNGPDGMCLIGFERKRLSDLLTSMRDRRLSGRQMRGCWERYDFVWIVSEGIYREGTGGEIEEWRWNPRTKKKEFMP